MPGVVAGIWALANGDIFIGLLILVIGVPVLLTVTATVLGLLQMILLFPIALISGRTRELMEYSNFTVAITEELGG